MIVSPASFRSSVPSLIRVSGELCLQPVSQGQDSFGSTSDQAFDAPETSRGPSRLRLQPSHQSLRHWQKPIQYPVVSSRSVQ